MTKQPHCATKRPLSRLFRWLAALCCFKLALLGVFLLDIPLPDLFPADAPPRNATPVASALPPASSEKTAPLAAQPPLAAHAPGPEQNRTLSSTLPPRQADRKPLPPATAAAVITETHLPQGAAAARLAATVQARAPRPATLSEADMPAPQVRPAPTAAAQPETGQAIAAAQPALPAPLPAPRVAPGTALPPPAPLLTAAPAPAQESGGWLDSLGLRNLPIPGLGSVRAAQAASLDMPVPQTPNAAASSPFTPAAQTAPLSLPGAPAIPDNIPRGQSADGSPLPPRGSADVPSLPQSSSSTGLAPAPAPAVRPAPAPVDPNLKAQELARQQQDIITLRRQMDQRLKDRQDAEKKVPDMIREARGLEDENIRKLVLTYGQMKPKAAAKALENMDERVAVRILTGMTPKQSGEIMTYMNPKQTAKLTELITRMRLPE